MAVDPAGRYAELSVEGLVKRFGDVVALDGVYLRIASGDIVDVDTLLTNTPAGLSRAGVADDKIQTSLKNIETALPRGNANRGPGGHILAGLHLGRHQSHVRPVEAHRGLCSLGTRQQPWGCNLL